MVNQLKKISPEFRRILKLSSSLADSLNFKIYLVGGIVRDLILGKDIFDLDIVVEGDAMRLAAGLSQKLSCEFVKHHAFGTATINWGGHKLDFATARTEKYSHSGSLPRVQAASLTEDLWRRDFTINAMAISLNKDDYGKLIDIYRGLTDLKKGIIRVLHDQSFCDDPTRILRGIRFEQRFGFRFDSHTRGLLTKALKQKVFNLVNPHRLRNELILILKEAKPEPCLRRIADLERFYFIDLKIQLNQEIFKLFDRIGRTLKRYPKQFRKSRRLASWTIYLGAMLIKFSPVKIKAILHKFGFKKGERIIVVSMRQGLTKMNKLKKRVSPKVIHRVLDQYSLEAILFFYAYYPHKQLRKNIEYFLNELIHSQIELRGRDLKELGFEPAALYGKILKRLSYAKLTNKLKNKSDEIKEAKIIFRRLKKRA